MPEIPDDHNPRNSYQRASHSDPSYVAPHVYNEPRYDYDHGDIAFDPEEHHRAYYNEPYQSAPQDIPLLGMPTHEEQFYDPEPSGVGLGAPSLHHRDSYASYASTEQPPRLHHRESSYTVSESPKGDNPPALDSGIKRSKTIKPVQLFHGNLVLDCPVPPKIINSFSDHEREFTHMRYTAATCDPADFFEQQFTLRQQLYGKPRKTELFIVVTMYNEDDLLFARTMAGVWQNIQFMCNGTGRNGGGSWGPDGWKRIVVCVVSDGRAKINERTKGVLTAMGCYQVSRNHKFLVLNRIGRQNLAIFSIT